MSFEWDDRKNRANIQIHGLDFADAHIDTSEIPPLTDKFFATAKWRLPKPKIQVIVEVEPEVLEWFQAQGEHYERDLAAALRLYARAHQDSE